MKTTTKKNSAVAKRREPVTLNPSSPELEQWNQAMRATPGWDLSDFIKNATNYYAGLLLAPNRLGIPFPNDAFETINKAASMEGLIMTDWILKTLLAAAGQSTKQAENTLIFHKCQECPHRWKPWGTSPGKAS